MFNIDIYKLQNGAHEYDFEIPGSFFDSIDQDIVKKGSGNVHVVLNKSETLISLDFDIDVKVELTCDRSLELFDHPIKVNKTLILKFGDEEEELDEDLMVIQRNTQRINLAQHIYEYIGLEIPMKKLHPKFNKEAGPELDEIIYTSNEGPENDTDNNDQAIDPRWAKLKNLK